MHDSGDSKDAESVHSGPLSHDASESALFSHQDVQGGLLGRSAHRESFLQVHLVENDEFRLCIWRRISASDNRRETRDSCRTAQRVHQRTVSGCRAAAAERIVGAAVAKGDNLCGSEGGNVVDGTDAVTS